jgi:pimeloyl-ACP methyl ester carboxylesterase
MYRLVPTIVLAVLVFLPACNWLGVADLTVAELKTRYGTDARFIEVMGAQVRIKESGSGEPLLLLHGFASSADTWDGWREALGAQFRVIAVDLPPFALTGPLPKTKMDGEALQAFMDALVAKLELDSFYLGGNSLGGYVSWSYARRHPEKVKKLLLVNSAGYPIERPFAVQLMTMPVVKDLASHFTPRPLVAANIRDVYGDPSLVTDAQIQRYHDMMLREGARPAVSELLASLDFNGAGVKDVKVPTLIMWGGKDRWIPPENAVKFQKDIAGSQLVIYEELGHIPMEEAPGITAVDVRCFLAGCK